MACKPRGIRPSANAMVIAKNIVIQKLIRNQYFRKRARRHDGTIHDGEIWGNDHL